MKRKQSSPKSSKYFFGNTNNDQASHIRTTKSTVNCSGEIKVVKEVQVSESTRRKLKILSFDSDNVSNTTNNCTNLTTTSNAQNLLFDGACAGSSNANQSIEASLYERDVSAPNCAQDSSQQSPSKLTRLQETYLSFRDVNPNVMLFIECGYKHYLFEEDAEVASPILCISCFMYHNYKTACVPSHRLNIHIRRLVSKGFKVGVVKQTETASGKSLKESKNKLFERKLSALYTKSTLIGEEVDIEGNLSEDHNVNGNINYCGYLLCVSEHFTASDSKVIEFGITAVRPTTGDCFYSCFKDGHNRENLQQCLSDFQPIEIIVSENIRQETAHLIHHFSNSCSEIVRVEQLPEDKFSFGKAIENLTTFRVLTPTESVNLPIPVICAFSAMVDFLKEFGLERVVNDINSMKLHEMRKNNTRLSYLTQRNLNVFTNRSNGNSSESLFGLFDKTNTSFGSRLLRDWVKHPLKNYEDIIERQDLIEEVMKSTEALRPLKSVMTGLPDLEYSLAAAYHYKAEIDDLFQQLHSHEEAVGKVIGIEHFSYSTWNNLQFLIEIPLEKEKLIPLSWRKINSTKSISRYRSPEADDYSQKLIWMEEEQSCICLEYWKQFMQNFSSNYFTFKEAVHCLAVLDCLFSIGDFSKQTDYCKPRVLCSENETLIDIVGGRHPVVEKYLDDDYFVPNNLHLDNNVKCLIITGPNMGGKSTFISQVGLIAILAQVGSYVPAVSVKLTPLDSIHIRMGSVDDIEEQRSTFYVETIESLNILNNITSKSLVLFDELGCGTSTHDGMAIAYSTLHHLLHEVQCLTLFVTHYIPITELATQSDSPAQNTHMTFDMCNSSDNNKEGHLFPPADHEKIYFLYKLSFGASKESYGLNAARLASLPSMVIENASRKADILRKAIQNRREARRNFVRLFSRLDSRYREVLRVVKIQED